MVNLFHRIEVNTGRSLAKKRLLDEHVALLLPTELTLQFGAVEINGEVGRNLVRSGASGSIYGVVTEIELPRGVELLGEFRSERTDGEPANWTMISVVERSSPVKSLCSPPQEQPCMLRLTKRSFACMSASNSTCPINSCSTSTSFASVAPVNRCAHPVTSSGFFLRATATR